MSCNSEMAFFPANFMLQTPSHEEADVHHHHHPAPSFSQIFSSNCTPQDYQGNLSLSLSLISVMRADHLQFPRSHVTKLSLLVGMAPFLGKRSMSFSGVEVGPSDEAANGDGAEDGMSDDDGSQAGEKKRRLNTDQVRTLERNFELGSKLEPERKMQLARALGLQPRQIAIWFQNRRARWKTKQLEKDYDLLKRQFDAIKSDNEALQAQNQKLQAQIQALKGSREPAVSINLNKDTEGSSSNRSENSSEFKLDISTRPPPPPPVAGDGSPLAQPPPPHPHSIISRQLFPTPASLRGSTGGGGGGGGGGGIAHQLLHGSLSSARPDLHLAAKEETLTSMFCGMDDQFGLWPWIDQQHFN
ncbi:hypothetical protein SAY86_020227 [Trapa natans]|uniref:Homeobox-leucine zipper protein n=1 Tax=Trapa natans TaxID=22666 RepID=A0AAN7LIP8_TRANT|nr:hypothetical protein SAY86_020227 [Trapa natans]